MLILGIVVLGLVGFDRMPWEMMPEVDFPYITVVVAYPGAARSIGTGRDEGEREGEPGEDGGLSHRVRPRAKVRRSEAPSRPL